MCLGVWVSCEKSVEIRRPSSGNDRVLDLVFLTVMADTLKYAGYQTKLMLWL